MGLWCHVFNRPELQFSQDGVKERKLIDIKDVHTEGHITMLNHNIFRYGDMFWIFNMFWILSFCFSFDICNIFSYMVKALLASVAVIGESLMMFFSNAWKNTCWEGCLIALYSSSAILAALISLFINFFSFSYTIPCKTVLYTL